MTIKKPTSRAMKTLQSISGEALTLGNLMRSIRLGEEMTLEQFSFKLGITLSHLCDIEKGRKTISPERAAKFAKILGYSREQFVRLSLQQILNQAGLKMTVIIEDHP